MCMSKIMKLLISRARTLSWKSCFIYIATVGFAKTDKIEL